MVIIIGAGISGLTVAWHLQKKNIDYLLLEATDRAGGYIQSERDGDYLFESGPNSLLADADLFSFLEELDLKSQILESNDVSKNRYIFRRGKYRKLPSKPQELLFNSFFSWKTKWAIYRELNKKPQNIENETLAGFFGRRFSREIVDYALNPFVSGIYAGNPEEMMLEKTFPLLKEYEQQYGSVIRGFMKNNKSERRKSISFVDGMETLPAKIAEKLENVVLKSKVHAVFRNEPSHEFLLDTTNGAYNANYLVVTSPAYTIPHYLIKLFPKFANAVLQIDYPKMCVVHTVYKKQDVRHPLNGFGGLNPFKENLFTLGSIWSGSTFKGRCPEDEVLFTSFVGGRMREEYAELGDEEIKTRVNQELKKNYQISNEPVFQKIMHWDKAIPQYNQNALEAQEMSKTLEKENIFICGNWVDGVSISDCIKKAKKIAEKITELKTNH